MFKLKLKASFCIAAAVVISSFLCGCNVFSQDTAELLSPPGLSGDAAPIAEAISSSAGGEYTLKYPSRGNFRSPVVQNDIDSDGILEAFAFYSRTVSNETAMYLSVITSENGKWTPRAQYKTVAGGVDKIEFCDLDGDGVQEIIVGWEIYGTSEMRLAVYKLQGRKIEEKMYQQYTNFVCCDLDEDGTSEILVINLNSAEQENSAMLYSLKNGTPSFLYGCELDKTVKSVNDPVVSGLSSGKTAVYIDEIKGVGAVTEVLFVEKNRLVNPLLNPESRETTATLRASGYSVKDINGDGIVEIPVQEAVPSVTLSKSNEIMYLTGWYSFNGEALTNQLTTLINNNDGYYYTVSARLVGHLAVLKDETRHLRELYYYDADTGTVGEQLISFMTVKKSDWDNGAYKSKGYTEIMHDGISSYICKVSADAETRGVTFSEVKKSFKLFE